MLFIHNVNQPPFEFLFAMVRYIYMSDYTTSFCQIQRDSDGGF